MMQLPMLLMHGLMLRAKKNKKILDKYFLMYYNDKADFKVDLSAALIFQGSLLPLQGAIVHKEVKTL